MVGLTQRVVEQLVERARVLAGVADELRRGEPLRAALELAEDRGVWSGAPQRVFCGWLGALDGWVRNQLAGGVAGVAERIESHARNLDKAQYELTVGLGAACPAPPRPVGIVPGRPPEFVMRLPAGPGAVAMAPDAMRDLVNRLGRAKDGLLAAGRRVEAALDPPALPPTALELVAIEVAAQLPAAAHLPHDAREAVGWPAAWLALANELDRALQDVLDRAARWERANRAEGKGDDRVGSVMAFLSASVAGLVRPARPAAEASAGLARAATMGPPAPTPPAGPVLRAPAPRDRRNQGGSDARRVLGALESGFFNLPEPDKARRILADGVEAARRDPEYAAGFLARLGPKGLAKLLDDGSLGPCVVGEFVARASVVRRPDGQPEFDRGFLDKALGKNKTRAARRATVLGACECPGAALRPEWTQRLVEVLYKGPDPAGKGDPRRWYRECAARLITQLGYGTPPGPPAGFEAETGIAVEWLIGFAAEHRLDPPGRAALAGVLATPEMMLEIGDRLALGGKGDPPADPGLGVSPTDLRKVLAELGSDPACGPLLVAAAEQAAGRRLTPTAALIVDDPRNPHAHRALLALGATLGALTAEAYPDSAAALNAAKVSAETVKGFVKSLAGVALKATGAGTVAILVVDSVQTVGFALGGGAVDQHQAEDKARELSDERRRRDHVRQAISDSLQYLCYATLLSDPATVSRLGVRLDPAAFPDQLPMDPTRPGQPDPLLKDAKVSSVDEWRGLLFGVPGNEGHLTIPEPSDHRRLAALRAWAHFTNPALAATANDMHETMQISFDHQITTST